MINNLIEEYKRYRRKTLKKGYQVVGLPLTISFFVLLIITIVCFFLIFEFSGWFLLFELILVIMLLQINKKVDKLLKKSWLNYELDLKKYIECFFKDKGINDPKQIRNLSTILKEKSKKKYKKYDLNPYLSMIIAVSIFVLSLLTSDDIKPLIVILAFTIIFIIISINPVINIFTNIFINGESEIIYELASIVDELYFEVSIKEVKQKNSSI